MSGMFPQAKFYIGCETGLFSFEYVNEMNWGQKTLEEAFAEIAKNLHGQNWIKQQRANLVVVGIDAYKHHYVLNNPAEWLVDRLAVDCDGEYIEPIVRRINNRRIEKVIVCNLASCGDEAVILKANVKAPTTKRGYCTLFPTYLSMNTQEIDAAMSALLDLHMLNMARIPGLKWLRAKYRDERQAKARAINAWRA